MFAMRERRRGAAPHSAQPGEQEELLLPDQSGTDGLLSVVLCSKSPIV